jgi:hypothetical protein
MGEHGKHRILLLGSMGMAAAAMALAAVGEVVLHEDVSPRRPIKFEREDFPPPMLGDRRRRPRGGSPAQRLLERQRHARLRAATLRSMPR